MTIQFPIFPDDTTFYSDNRVIIDNRQLITRLPAASDEEPLMSFATTMADLPSGQRGLPQSQRQRYASVKRSLGEVHEGEGAYRVNTYERSVKKSVAEESKEKARNYLRNNQPKKLKGYVSPLERKREQQGFQRQEEKPRINEERMKEYMDRNKKRQAVDVSSNVKFEDTVEIEPMTGVGSSYTHQGDLFSREKNDYFQKKRESLFNRGL